MKLNVVHGESVQQIDVDSQMTVLMQSASQFELLWKQKPLLEALSLVQVGVQNEDIVIVQPKNSNSSGSSGGGGARVSLNDIPRELYQQPQQLIDYISSRPALVQELISSNPSVAEAILSGNVALLQQTMAAQSRERQQAENKRNQDIQALNDDPLNPEAQKRIAEQIRQQNVAQNMEQAMMHNPESFGRVCMLYIPTEVNGVKVKAFVDSGAQSTIMSVSCAKRCNIMHLVDTRFAGIAKGVGEARILGRVHAARIKIGKETYQCSFTILDQEGVEFLFGLDQLKRHQACIDLKHNCLDMGGQKIEFLSEKDLPSSLFSENPGDSKHSSSSSSGASSASSSSSSANNSNSNNNSNNNNSNNNSNKRSHQQMSEAEEAKAIEAGRQ
jgi:DNA damage-inducible protein 1